MSGEILVKSVFTPITARFVLPDVVKDELKAMTPQFGFNGLGELVFRRTYSCEGEEWADVVIRVIEGIFAVRKNHYLKMGLAWEDQVYVEYARNMALSLFRMEWLPPGRGLWMTGRDYMYNRSGLALVNCAAVDTEEDLVFAIEWSMDALMNGCGIGFNTSWCGDVVMPDKTDTEDYQIPDSREGWISSVIKLMCSYVKSSRYPPSKFPVFDYSCIRPAGLPIKGFGGTSSGPEPLRVLHERLVKFLDYGAAGRITGTSKQWKPDPENEGGPWIQVDVDVDKPYSKTRLVADLFNAVGACVVAGNVRRCKPEGTLVFTSEGLKKIEDVNVGDKVKTSSGYSKVTECLYQGPQELLCIETQLGKSWCTPSHHVAVLDSPDSYTWKRAKDLTSDDYMIFPLEGIKGTEQHMPAYSQEISDRSSAIVIPELDAQMAWFIGYFQVNGNVYKNIVTISMNFSETEIISRVVNNLEKFHVKIIQKNDGNDTKVYVYNKNLADYLKHLKKSWSDEMDVPNYILQSSMEIRASYLAGLYDTDETSKEEGRFSVLITSTCPEFLYQLQSVCGSMGIPIQHKFIREPKTIYQKSTYELQTLRRFSKIIWKKSASRRSSIHFAEYQKDTNYIADYDFPVDWFQDAEKTPSETRIKSSLLPADEHINTFKANPIFLPVKVVAISSPGRIAETFDLSVEDDHQYVCGAGLLEHNSAEISLGDPEDDDFINLKNYEINPERGEIGWMSNNSVVLKADRDYEDFSYIPKMAKRIVDNGEPGMINLYNIQKYARFGKESPDEATLVNPCVTADTWVSTPKGARQVKDLINTPFEAVVGGVVTKCSQGFYSTGKKPVFELLTEEGFHVKATGNHRFFVVHTGQMVELPLDMSDNERSGKWVCLEEMKEGDALTVNLTINHTTKFDAEDFQSGFEQSLELFVSEDIEKVSPDFEAGVLARLYNKYGHACENNSVIVLKPKLTDFSYASPLFMKNFTLSNILVKVQRMLLRQGVYANIQQDEMLCISRNSAIIAFYKNVGFGDAKRNQLLRSQLCHSQTHTTPTSLDPFSNLDWSIATFKSAELVGDEETYDCTMDDTTRPYFDANGLTAHNCGEIPLCSTEVCNLSEVFPPRCASPDVYYKALEYATYYASTVTLLPTHRPETNAIVSKNRRIGVSISGITQWANGVFFQDLDASSWPEMNYTAMQKFLREGYKTVRRVNKNLAASAGIPESIRVCTIKPSGSISLLAGVTPGMHYPVSRYAIRRVRIGKTSPLVPTLIAANVPHEDDKFSDGTLIFEFVIDHGPVPEAESVSAWEQLSLAASLQRHYSDNAVSVSVYFHKEKEGPEVERMLAMYIPVLKTVSMLPHSGHGYAQAPYEPISKEEYERRLSEFTYPVYGAETSKVEPIGSKFCTNDTCEM